jgi:hypothetical protein
LPDTEVYKATLLANYDDAISPLVSFLERVNEISSLLLCVIHDPQVDHHMRALFRRVDEITMERSDDE